VARLFVVGTPIGNLEDITLRALRTLREVGLIAAEDTRKARNLLRHYEIDTPLTSYFEGNERQKISTILAALEQGDVALISEAGLPGISDPGFPLIQAAIENNIPITVIPGPSAHSMALVASGLPTDRFMFIGFLPRKKSERLSTLEDLIHIKASLIFYEAPHRLCDTLTDLHSVFGNRTIAMCRELTKIYEEIWRGDLDDAIDYVRNHKPKGEYTLVLAGAEKTGEKWSREEVKKALIHNMKQGYSRSQSARKIAHESGWSRHEVYDIHTDESPHS
jgi:16S rRNA (cytidine1402-2'-O)-methyltransferase